MNRLIKILFSFLVILITYSLFACSDGDFESLEEHNNQKNVNSTTVTIKSRGAGTLLAYYGDELSNIKRLKVIGDINAIDFEGIRYQLSTLEFIDLSKASITAYRGYRGTHREWEWTYHDNELPSHAFKSGTTCSKEAGHNQVTCYTYRLFNLKEVILPKTICGINLDAFGGGTQIEVLKIPANLEYISAGQNFSRLKSISVAAPIPPKVSDNDFLKIPDDAILYVPKGKKALYEKAIGWKRIKNIVEK